MQLPHPHLDAVAPAPEADAGRSACRTVRGPDRSASSAVAADRWASHDASLAEAAESRQQQLRGLLEAGLDPIAVAQRDTLEQTLEDIAAARKRLAAGTYGTCVRCAMPVPAERLELRPWASTCVTC